MSEWPVRMAHRKEEQEELSSLSPVQGSPRTLPFRVNFKLRYMHDERVLLLK